MFANFGPGHWAVLAIVLVLVFGSRRLPDAARALGKSLRIFKSEVRELQNDGKTETPPAPATPVESERVDPGPTTDQPNSEARPA